MKKVLIDLKALILSFVLRKDFNRTRTELVIKMWRKRGVKIGENCYINFDVSLERGVEIGDGTTITGGSIVLTHDAVPATFLPELDGGDLFKRKCRRTKVKIGKQCFICARSLILPGVTIGDRCIVAAGAIVTKDVPSGCVIAGNPAKVICTIDEYIAKQKKRYELNREMYW